MRPGRWRSWLSAAGPGELLIKVPRFNFLAGPGIFAQKRQTGFDAGIDLEAADRDTISHLSPTMLGNQLRDDGLQRDAVQRIAGMGGR